MSKVISVLEKMASDAAMNSENAIADLVATSDINNGQIQAILASDGEALVESTTDLPEVKCFFIIVSDDEEEEQTNTIDNKTAVNF